MKKPDSQNICNTGEYYIASVLSANGFTTTITLGRAEKYDIIAINPNGVPVKVQVKTLFGKGPQWRMGPKHEKEDQNLFYIFIRLNDMEGEPEYWVVPSKVVASYVKWSYNKWLKSPGKKNQKHRPGPWRAFRVKEDKYSPENWTKICKKYYKNINPLYY